MRTTDRYATIGEVNRAAITEFGVNEIFHETCGALRRVIPYDRMGLSPYAADTGALKLVATIGCDSDSYYRVGLSLDCKETHHGWVFQHKKAMLRRDLQREVEFQIEQHNVTEGIRSYCAVPLIIRGESIGVLIALSSHKGQYAEVHAEFLQEVSDQLVLAIRSLIPICPKHSRTNLICPRCIASSGGGATAVKHQSQLSNWGKQGGRGRKKASRRLDKASPGIRRSRGHGNVLPAPSSHQNDLSSLHRQKGRENYDSQIQKEAFPMGQERRTSQNTVSTMLSP